MALFKSRYTRSTMLTSNQLQSATKTQLLKEARRLANLIKRRMKQITKRGYDSYAYEQLKMRESAIKQGTYYEDNPLGISKNFSNEMLQDMIRDFDTFLMNKSSSTVDYIEDRIPKELTPSQQAVLQSITRDLGHVPTNQEWAKANFILDNSEYASEFQEIMSSDVITSIMLSEYSAPDIIERMRNFVTSNKDDYYLDELKRDVFGIKEDE